ncbi:hypothetical protein [Streptomyces sp. NPDC058572]|uniref:hypothetical protein n=1 Tax=Streptomyces sp. NPDC058572 TaxID=3346546 RepID=UPI00365E2EBA
MSTPQSPYGQPNPYGQQPYAQPGPYAPQPYAQQPPMPPRPHPGPGWGGLPPAPPPPPQPPRKKNRTVLTVAVALGSALAVLAVAWFGNNVDLRSDRRGGSSSSDSASSRGADSGGNNSGDKSKDGFPEAKYRLTVPRTLLGGKYELAEDKSAEQRPEMADMSEANIRDPQPAVAHWLSESDGGVLAVSGLYGSIKDPDEARDAILRGAAGAKGAAQVVAPRNATPAGSDVTITCQVLTGKQQDGSTMTFPMCAWADDNTNGSVAMVTPATAAQSPQDVDMDVVAETTVKVREEMRKPVG